MKKNGNVIVGLDIGTTKVCAVVAEIRDGELGIIGVGTHASGGLRKGVVVNIDSTVAAITKAIEEAELMAGCEINSVYAGVSGSHIEGMNSHGVVAIGGKEVREGDVARVIDAAKAIPIPMDREIIHIIPQEYVIDDQDGIKDPIGMSGVRLECRVHIITGAITSTQNIIKCANRAGLTVDDVVLEQLAASDAVLSADERELGAVLVDIGGGTTNVIVYCNGSVKYTSILALGGNHITNDIAVGLRTPINDAVKIKEKYGVAIWDLVGSNETIEVPSVGGRAPRVLSRKVLAEIIEPRIEEIMSLVYREIIKSGFEEQLASGVVITGGTALIPGIEMLGEKIIGMPVRKGSPKNISGLSDVVASPEFSTAVGLVLYGVNQRATSGMTNRGDSMVGKMKMKMKGFLEEFF